MPITVLSVKFPGYGYGTLLSQKGADVLKSVLAEAGQGTVEEHRVAGGLSMVTYEYTSNRHQSLLFFEYNNGNLVVSMPLHYLDSGSNVKPDDQEFLSRFAKNLRKILPASSGMMNIPQSSDNNVAPATSFVPPPKVKNPLLRLTGGTRRNRSIKKRKASRKH